MQSIKKAIEKTRETSDLTLVNAFGILENDNITWQLNYINKNNKIVTFINNTKSTEQKTLEGKIPKPLNLKEINFDIKETLKILDKTLKKYPKETPTKTIITLHTIKNKTFWNFTLLTSSLKVINIRIDATTGKVIKEKSNHILEFKSKN